MKRRDFLVGLFSLIPIVFLFRKLDDCPYIDGDPNIKYIRSQPEHKDIPQNRDISKIMKSIERQAKEISELPQANYCIVDHDTYIWLSID